MSRLCRSGRAGVPGRGPSRRGVRFMQRRIAGILRFLCVIVLIVMASLGAVAALTGLSPRQFLALTPAGRASPGPAPARRSAAQAIPLYSDVSVDDSGISLAVQYEQAESDPGSLAQVAAARKGRGERGIARLAEKLARLGRLN